MLLIFKQISFYYIELTLKLSFVRCIFFYPFYFHFHKTRGKQLKTLAKTEHPVHTQVVFPPKRFKIYSWQGFQ